MLVTTFYLAMTFINAWRMRSLKSHLLQFMSWKSSAVLYKLPSGVSLIKSKLVIEQKVHYITDIIEINDHSRMCRLRPIQCIDVNRWLSTSDGTPLWSNNIFQELDSNPKLGVYIECEMEPCMGESINDIVHLESLGQVWAWRVYNNLEFIAIIPFNNILELSYKFLYGSLKINHGLPVVRIQTVYAAGVPYRGDDVQMNQTKNIIRKHYKNTQEPIDWAYYGGVLKQTNREIFTSKTKTSARLKTTNDSFANIQPEPSQQIYPDLICTDLYKDSEETSQILESQGTQTTIPEILHKLAPETDINKKTAQEITEELKFVSTQIKEKTITEPIQLQTPDSRQTSISETLQLLTQDTTQNHKSEPKEVLSKDTLEKKSQDSIQVPRKNATPEPIQVHIQDATRKTTQESIEVTTKDATRKLTQILKREPAIELKQDRVFGLTTQETTKISIQLPTQFGTQEPKRESTPEPIPGSSNTVVRSESVAIHQRLSPSRKTNKGNVATTIKSITTHRKVTSTVPPSEGKQTYSTSSESSISNMSSNRSPQRRKELSKSKALNVLVYSESLVARNNLISTLINVLDPDRYVVYPISLEVISEGVWRSNVALIAVVGNTGGATPFLVRHFLNGGRLLAICSDLLQAVVPYYRTAEIRENEIVQFTYDKWKSVKMKHHVLCFQASPAKKQFSSDSDRQASQDNNILCVMDHELAVDVLAREETWRTPSLIQVVNEINNGVSIFSQIHLETNPTEYLGEEGPRSDKNRYEILLKVLGDVIKLHVKDKNEMPQVEYTEGYFFGDNEIIQTQLPELCPNTSERVLKLRNMAMEWLFDDQEPAQPPAPLYLPVRVMRIPHSFCYETYIKNLTSTRLGRVVLYSDVIGSTALWNEFTLFDGLAIVAGRQLSGEGRSGNLFISPPGQAIISLQIRQKISETIPLLQNVAALAVVLAIRQATPYEHLNIRIKWPNDIYCGREAKIGGVMTKARYLDDMTTINMGIGINISNNVPTTCINEMIQQHNLKCGTALPEVKVEWFLARFCSHFEELLTSISTDAGKQSFYSDYYKYWLHNKEEIEVINRDGRRVSGVVHGIDGAGFLVVDTSAGRVTVSPDGNSFDIMTNLIVTKC